MIELLITLLFLFPLGLIAWFISRLAVLKRTSTMDVALHKRAKMWAVVSGVLAIGVVVALIALIGLFTLAIYHM